MRKIVQFGFKFADPSEFVKTVEGFGEDSPVVDCRVLKNPYTPYLSAEECMQMAESDPLFEKVVAEGVAGLEWSQVIAVGCAYGKHRSGAVIREIVRRYEDAVTVVRR